MVADPSRRWTYEDLCHLPDDGKRYEIIYGELYELPAPNRSHASAVINLLATLIPMVFSLGARIFTAPFGVFIPGSDPVEPDVFVLMPDQLHLLSMRGVEGAPALVIEIL